MVIIKKSAGRVYATLITYRYPFFLLLGTMVERKGEERTIGEKPDRKSEVYTPFLLMLFQTKRDRQIFNWQVRLFSHPPSM
jgi:hypothetical protein